MTTIELANTGLRLIEHAILETIRDRGPMQPHEVADALDLRAERSALVTYAVMSGMAAAGILEKGPGEKPKYHLPGSQATHG